MELMPRDITYDVHVDWDDDGDFSDANEDVSADVQRPIKIRYGRDQARSFAPPAAGSADFDVANREGKYSPDNAAGPLFGKLLPGRELRIQATHDAVTYPLYRGFLDDFRVTPAVGVPMVSLAGLDALARFRGVKLSTAVMEAVQTGDVIHRILDEVGWPVDARDIDRGVTTVRWWWSEGDDALSALEKVVNSEGPPALLTVSGAGEVVFRDRHHRLTRAASLTSQATFSASGGPEPVHAHPLVYDIGWRDIVNSVEIEVDELSPAKLPSNVFESEQIYTVPAGNVVEVAFTAGDPFIDAVSPVAGTDFRVLAGSVTTSLSRTSGQSSVVRLRASTADATIEGLRVRAYSLAARQLRVEVENPASIQDFGRRSYTQDAPWCGVHDAKAIGDIILAHRSVRLPTVTMRLQGSVDERILQQLSRDLSDRITIIEPSISLNHSFFIDLIEHTISGDGKVHETLFGCEMVPVRPSTPFTFGVSGRGFGQGQFDATGLDDPATMFRFDTPGQGFNQGRFAT